jgi:hypothetical protein
LLFRTSSKPSGSIKKFLDSIDVITALRFKEKFRKYFAGNIPTILFRGADSGKTESDKNKANGNR